MSDPYWLDPIFEKQVAFLCCTSPDFLTRIGLEVETDCLGLDTTKLAISAAQALARVEGGRPPSSPVVVLQKLRNDAKTKVSTIAEVADMLDEVYDGPKVDEEGVVQQLTVVLKDRIANKITLLAIDESKKRGGTFEKTAALIEKASNLGVVKKRAQGDFFASREAFANVEELRSLEKLSTSIDELDLVTGGGLRRGCLGIYAGGPGDGKSCALSQQAAYASSIGLFTAIATLEVPKGDETARIAAALLGEAIDDIIENPWKYHAQIVSMKLAPIVIEEFTPQATTFKEIEDWVADLERVAGRKLDLLITDYGDKLVLPGSSGSRREDGGYHKGLEIFERMRVWAKQKNIWHWTASATKRREKGKKVTGVDDLADSQHKARVCDMLVTLNVQEDEQIVFSVAKNRFGRGKTATVPLPTDFAYGRIAPMSLGREREGKAVEASYTVIDVAQEGANDA